MKRELISDIYKSPESYDGKQITVAGWARSIRASNEFGFADLNGTIEVDVLKSVEQSYLTQLWSNDVFKKDKSVAFTNITNLKSSIANALATTVTERIGPVTVWPTE